MSIFAVDARSQDFNKIFDYIAIQWIDLRHIFAVFVLRRVKHCTHANFHNSSYSDGDDCRHMFLTRILNEFKFAHTFH